MIYTVVTFLLRGFHVAFEDEKCTMCWILTAFVTLALWVQVSVSVTGCGGAGARTLKYPASCFTNWRDVGKKGNNEVCYHREGAPLCERQASKKQEGMALPRSYSRSAWRLASSLTHTRQILWCFNRQQHMHTHVDGVLSSNFHLQLLCM